MPASEKAGDGSGYDFGTLLSELMEHVGSVARVSGAGGAALLKQIRTVVDASSAMGALPAVQLRSLSDMIRNQRDQIRVLTRQLQLFDEQLTRLDEMLQPMIELNEQWSSAQQRVLNQVRKLTGPGQ